MSTEESFFFDYANIFATIDIDSDGAINKDIIKDWCLNNIDKEIYHQKIAYLLNNFDDLKDVVNIIDWLSFAYNHLYIDNNNNIVINNQNKMNHIIENDRETLIEKGMEFDAVIEAGPMELYKMKPANRFDKLHNNDNINIEWKRIFLFYNKLKQKNARSGAFYWNYIDHNKKNNENNKETGEAEEVEEVEEAEEAEQQQQQGNNNNNNNNKYQLNPKQMLPLHRIVDVFLGKTSDILFLTDASISSGRCCGLGSKNRTTLHLIGDTDKEVSNWLQSLRKQIGDKVNDNFFIGASSLSSGLTLGVQVEISLLDIDTYNIDNCIKVTSNKQILWISENFFVNWANIPEYGQILTKDTSKQIACSDITDIIFGFPNKSLAKISSKLDNCLLTLITNTSQKVTFIFSSLSFRNAWMYSFKKIILDGLLKGFKRLPRLKLRSVITDENGKEKINQQLPAHTINLVNGCDTSHPMLNCLKDILIADSYTWTKNLIWVVSHTAKFKRLWIRDRPDHNGKILDFLSPGQYIRGIRVWNNWLKHSNGWSCIQLLRDKHKGIALHPIDTNLYANVEERLWIVTNSKLRIRNGPSTLCISIGILKQDDIVDAYEIYDGWLHHRKGWSRIKNDKDDVIYIKPINQQERLLYNNKLLQVTYKGPFTRLQIRNKPNLDENNIVNPDLFFAKGDILHIKNELYDEQGNKWIEHNSGYSIYQLNNRQVLTEIILEKYIVPKSLFWQVLQFESFTRLRCRDGPSITSNTIGFLSKGEIIRVYWIIDNKWLKHNKGWSIKIDHTNKKELIKPLLTYHQDYNHWITRNSLMLLYEPKIGPIGTIYYNKAIYNTETNELIKTSVNKLNAFDLDTVIDITRGNNTFLFRCADLNDNYYCLDSHCITLIGKKFEFHLEINSDDMADQFAKALVFILKGGNKVIRSEIENIPKMRKKLIALALRRNSSISSLKRSNSISSVTSTNRESSLSYDYSSNTFNSSNHHKKTPSSFSFIADNINVYFENHY